MNNSDFSNLNITPEMIQNLASMLSNSSNQNDFSNGNSVSSESDNQKHTQSFSSDSFNNNIDFDSILKMKSVFENLNKKDDPRNNLLYSLKPYLRETRQKKIDQYVNLLKITQVTDLLKNEKGDEK